MGESRPTVCPAEEELSALLDDALSSSQVRAYERHIEGCSECSRKIQALRSLKEALGVLPAPVMEPALQSQLLKRLEGAALARNSEVGPRKLPKPALAAMGTTFLLFIGLAVWLFSLWPLQSPSPLVTDTVQYYRSQKSTPAATVTSSPEVLEAQLSAEVGMTIRLPRFPQARLEKSQVVVIAGVPTVLAWYRFGDGEEVLVAVQAKQGLDPPGIKPAEKDGRRYHTARLLGQQVVAFEDRQGHPCVFVATLSRERLVALALAPESI